MDVHFSEKAIFKLQGILFAHIMAIWIFIWTFDELSNSIKCVHALNGLILKTKEPFIDSVLKEMFRGEKNYKNNL